MANPSGDSEGVVSKSFSTRVDGVRDAFQAAWKCGVRPRIEDYLRSFAESYQHKVLQELLVLELEHRHRLNEQPTPEEYSSRFPQNEQVIANVFSSSEGDESVADPSLRELLLKVDANATVQQETAEAATGHPEPPTVGPERFRSIRLHRRGGLGQVWLAEDQELRRRVALKELRKEHSDKAESRLRFVAEARITGALEHPGVVPVHAFGVHADGRPYYAMRFIQGENLRDAIKSFHSSRRAPTKSSERLLELRGLLGRFTSVCNTIHFAHSHQVVHRDLKPENIMLGKYGETLVVDWGLAKLLDGKDVSESTGATAAYTLGGLSPDANNVETQMGSILGTLQYMSPEQAAGLPSAASAASDIYSLGATLYCLLVGCPPQTGKDSALVLEKVRRSDFPRPREVQREVPRALEAICLHAMALEPSERYATAQDMALDVERWLADEPVSTYRESRWERLARWIRRRSDWMQALVLMLVVATAVFFVAAILINKARQGESVAHRLATQESAKSKEISKFLLSLFQPSDPIGFANGDITEFRFREFHSDVSALELLDRGARRIEEELADQPELRAELQDQIGGVYRTLGLFDAAVELHRKALEVKREILPAGDPDIAASLHNLGWALTGKGEHAEAEESFRAALEIRREHPGEQMVDLTATMQVLALVMTIMHKYDEAEPLYNESIAIQREQFGNDHQSVAIGLSALAGMQLDKGDEDQANSSIIEAYTIFCGQEGYSQPGRTLGQYMQGLAALEDGRYVEAEEKLRSALSVARELLGDSHPYVAWALYDYGRTLLELERFEEARQALLEAERIATATTREDHPKLATLRCTLAYNYAYLEEYDEAVRVIQKALNAIKRAYGPESEPFCSAMADLGEIYRLSGDLEKAVQTLGEALEIAKAAFSEDPDGPLYQLRKLIDCCLEKGDLDVAEAACRDVLAFQQKQSVDRTEIGKTLGLLGRVLLESGELDAAERALRQSLEARGEKPGSASASIAWTKSHLGACLAGQRRFEEAEALLLEAHKTLRDRSGEQDEQDERTLRTVERLVEMYRAWDKPKEAADFEQLNKSATP